MQTTDYQQDLQHWARAVRMSVDVTGTVARKPLSVATINRTAADVSIYTALVAGRRRRIYRRHSHATVSGFAFYVLVDGLPTQVTAQELPR